MNNRQRALMAMRQVVLNPTVNKDTKKSIGQAFPSLVKNAKFEYRRKYEKDIFFEEMKKALVESRFGDAHLLLETIGKTYIQRLSNVQKLSLIAAVFWEGGKTASFTFLDALRNMGFKLNDYSMYAHAKYDLIKKNREAFLQRMADNGFTVDSKVSWIIKNMAENNTVVSSQSPFYGKIIDYVLRRRAPGENVRAAFRRVLRTNHGRHVVRSGDANLIRRLQTTGFTFDTKNLEHAILTLPANKSAPAVEALLNVGVSAKNIGYFTNYQRQKLHQAGFMSNPALMKKLFDAGYRLSYYDAESLLRVQGGNNASTEGRLKTLELAIRMHHFEGNTLRQLFDNVTEFLHRQCSNLPRFYRVMGIFLALLDVGAKLTLHSGIHLASLPVVCRRALESRVPQWLRSYISSTVKVFESVGIDPRTNVVGDYKKVFFRNPELMKKLFRLGYRLPEYDVSGIIDRACNKTSSAGARKQYLKTIEYAVAMKHFGRRELDVIVNYTANKLQLITNFKRTISSSNNNSNANSYWSSTTSSNSNNNSNARVRVCANLEVFTIVAKFVKFLLAHGAYLHNKKVVFPQPCMSAWETIVLKKRKRM